MAAAHRAYGAPTFTVLEEADLDSPEAAAVLETRHLLSLWEQDCHRVLNLRKPMADDYFATFPEKWTPIDGGQPCQQLF